MNDNIGHTPTSSAELKNKIHECVDVLMRLASSHSLPEDLQQTATAAAADIRTYVNMLREYEKSWQGEYIALNAANNKMLNPSEAPQDATHNERGNGMDKALELLEVYRAGIADKVWPETLEFFNKKVDEFMASIKQNPTS